MDIDGLVPASWEVRRGLSDLRVKQRAPALDEYLEEYEARCNSDLPCWKGLRSISELEALPGAEARPSNSNASRSAQESEHPVESKSDSRISLPLNPYNADVFGLDKALRECQIEMTKIVHEVCVYQNSDRHADIIKNGSCNTYSGRHGRGGSSGYGCHGP